MCDYVCQVTDLTSANGARVCASAGRGQCQCHVWKSPTHEWTIIEPIYKNQSMDHGVCNPVIQRIFACLCQFLTCIKDYIINSVHIEEWWNININQSMLNYTTKDFITLAQDVQALDVFSGKSAVSLAYGQNLSSASTTMVFNQIW